MNLQRHITCVIALAAILLPTQLWGRDTEKPNVILIFADDLGPGILGCYGQQIIKTPNIDRLATEGMKFTNYYGATFCAPSRFTLLTGMHDGRMGGWGYNKAGLPIKRDLGEITGKSHSFCIIQPSCPTVGWGFLKFTPTLPVTIG